MFSNVRQGRDVLLVDDHVLEHQAIDLGIGHAADGILGGADDGLSPHIEGGIDEDRAARFCPERFKQLVETGARLAVHGLDPR